MTLRTSLLVAGYAEIKLTYHHNPAEPAAASYARLQREARQACRLEGLRGLKFNAVQQECAKGLVDKAVTRIADAELSQQHQYASRQVLTGGAASGR